MPCIYIYMSVGQSACLLSVSCLPIVCFLSVLSLFSLSCLFVVCLSLYLAAYVFLYLSRRESVCLLACLSTCRPVCLSACLLVCLFACLSFSSLFLFSLVTPKKSCEHLKCCFTKSLWRQSHGAIFKSFRRKIYRKSCRKFERIRSH